MLLRSYGVEPDVHKIAVLRVNALGDFIVALPAIEALRAAYPEAEIILLGGAWHAAFLQGRPGPVDRVVVVPPSRGVRVDTDEPEDPAELERFFDEMVRERFDLAVQIHGGGGHSNPFALRLGARLTVGLKAADAAPLDRWVAYIHYQSEILRFLEVVALVGAVPRVLEPRIVVTADDLAEARGVVPEESKPLVALHPGATDPRRCWPAEQFAAVGDALAAEGARIVVTGTKSEQAIVGAVVDAMHAPAENLCGRLSLGGLTGLLSRCSVVVSNDTGPQHLAAAVGTATVAIYWCGNLINVGPLTRSRHRPAISWRLACPVCGVDCTRVRCEHTASFVSDVTPEEVIASARDLLASAPHTQ